MQANWNQIALWVRLAEGGFADNPADPGGATKYGITLRVLQATRQRPCGVADVRALSWAEAQTILKAQYWDAVHGDDLPPGLDYCVVDAAFNSGVTQAIRWLQRSLRVTADGHYGAVTAQAVRGITDLNGAINAYDNARLGFLRHLRAWPVFGKGWFSRVNTVTTRASTLAAASIAARGTV